jgi:hypothetical protein
MSPIITSSRAGIGTCWSDLGVLPRRDLDPSFGAAEGRHWLGQGAGVRARRSTAVDGVGHFRHSGLGGRREKVSAMRLLRQSEPTHGKEAEDDEGDEHSRLRSRNGGSDGVGASDSRNGSF